MTETASVPPILELKGIGFAWPDEHGREGAGRAVFSGLDFALGATDKVGLYGPNGCGKTTLLRVATGLLAAQAGTVLLDGKPVSGESAFRELRCAVGFVLQNAEDQLFFPEVIEDIAFGPLNLGLSQQEALRVSRETLASLGLEGFEHRLTDRLSGGEKKLVSIAAVLAMRPRALLLDEPTTGLDEKAKTRLTEVLTALSIPRVVVSHDWDFLMAVSDTFATLEGGRVVACGRPEVHTHRHVHPMGHVTHSHGE